MFNKTQLQEDIQKANTLVQKVSWFIYNFITIGSAISIAIYVIYLVYMLQTATPEMIEKIELSGQLGEVQNFIVFGTFAFIGIILIRLITRFIRKRYFH